MNKAHIKFWGVRGSNPTPDANKIKYMEYIKYIGYLNFNISTLGRKKQAGLNLEALFASHKTASDTPATSAFTMAAAIASTSVLHRPHNRG